jgi:hypothetical protein
VRDLVVSRGPSGRAAEVTVKSAGGMRTMLSENFRRALELRSTWFAVRVLNLEQPQGRSLAVAGRSVILKGFVRGLGKVRLEQQVSGGTWTTVRRVHLRPDGHFTVKVAPKRVMSYRLATPLGAGAAITVKAR